MNNENLDNSNHIDHFVTWWYKLAEVSGLSHVTMVVLTTIVLSVMLFLLGGVISLFIQSLLAIFNRKPSNNPFEVEDD